MKNLSLISTAELVAEVQARYDCAVFAGLRNMDAAQEETDYWYSGGAYTVLGLLLWLTAAVRDALRQAPEHD
jgi:hypothetical protein